MPCLVAEVEPYDNEGNEKVNEEQQGKERADYGTYLLQNLAKRLEPEFGSGFSYRQLKFCRQFYRTYPNRNTLRSQLNWSQYRRLIQIDDPNKREYYELESANNAWTARETGRQIDSMLYERLLMSNDKESVLAMARKERIPESPTGTSTIMTVARNCQRRIPQSESCFVPGRMIPLCV